MARAGMAETTGGTVAAVDHVVQSIRNIAATPIGSLVLQREYGSRLPDLIDAPVNEETKVEAFAAIAEALDRWEPDFRLTRIQVIAADAGRMTFDLIGIYLADGQEITVEGVVA